MCLISISRVPNYCATLIVFTLLLQSARILVVAYTYPLPAALVLPPGYEECEQGPFPGLVVHLLPCLGVHELFRRVIACYELCSQTVLRFKARRF